MVDSLYHEDFRILLKCNCQRISYLDSRHLLNKMTQHVKLLKFHVQKNMFMLLGMFGNKTFGHYKFVCDLIPSFLYIHKNCIEIKACNFSLFLDWFCQWDDFKNLSVVNWSSTVISKVQYYKLPW